MVNKQSRLLANVHIDASPHWASSLEEIEFSPKNMTILGFTAAISFMITSLYTYAMHLHSVSNRPLGLPKYQQGKPVI